MRRHGWSLKIIAVAALFAMLFSSCQGAQNMPVGNSEQLRELGDAVVRDLQTIILPNRDTPSNLLDYGYVVFDGVKTEGVDALAKFFVTYEGGNDGDVTVVFTGNSFVVSRVTFIQGAGYYFRYEYDKFNPDEIAISGQLIDDVDLKYSKGPPKWDMKLRLKNKEVAHFLFKNPVEN